MSASGSIERPSSGNDCFSIDGAGVGLGKIEVEFGQFALEAFWPESRGVRDQDCRFGECGEGNLDVPATPVVGSTV